MATTAAPKFERASSWRASFGESAIWSASDRGLWWVDLHGHCLIFTAEDGGSTLWKTAPPAFPVVRAVMLHEDGGLVVALGEQLVRFSRDQGFGPPIATNILLPNGHVFNDATVDSAGRIIIGTMLPGRGDDGRAILCAIDGDGSATLLVEGLNTVNGLAFAPDGRTLFWSDSHADVRRVWTAAYDPDSARLGPASLFVDFGSLPGKPDGAAVDVEGHYWSAAVASRFLHRFDSQGRLDASIELPTAMPTRPCFGGAGLDQLYLTTGGLANGERDDGLRGAILRCSPGARGLAAFPAKISPCN